MSSQYLIIMLSIFVMLVNVAACSSTTLQNEGSVATSTPLLPPSVEFTNSVSDIPDDQGEGLVITPTPIPLLPSSVEFADGVSDVPDDYALFVEFWRHNSGQGDCEEMNIDFPAYEFANGQLTGEGFFNEVPNNQSRIIIGIGDSLGGTAGGGVSSGLEAIDLLPYQINGNSTVIIIRAVDNNGAIVAEIDGELYWVRPGEQWKSTVERQYAGDCQIKETETFTNHGLLHSSRIDVDYWDGVTTQSFEPGMVQPILASLPCVVEQPLGTGGWIWDIEIGQDGAMWIAASKGVARLDPNSNVWKAFSTSDGLPANSVRFVTPDMDGKAWLAFWDGASYYFNGKEWEPFDSTQQIEGSEVNDISIAPDHSVWFATDNGVYQWVRETDTWNHFTEADGLHDNRILNVLFTPDGKVWFSSYGSVSYFDTANLIGGSEAWWSFSTQSHGDGYDVAATSEDGKVWFGGQHYFDSTNQAWSDTVYNGFAYDIAIDHHGGLWVATEDGAIYVPDPNESSPDEWLLFTIADQPGGNSIRSLAVDDEGFVWFGAENSTVSRCTFEQ